MFRQLQNIDSAFRHIRTFSLLFLLACTLLTGFALYRSELRVRQAQERVYVLAAGQAWQAEASSRSENIPVEARHHVATFHRSFFGLDPDEKVIEANITKALYLADGSAKRTYDNLREKGYYRNLIAANVSQELTIDSVQLDTGRYPYAFRCYARQRLVRSTSILTRSLVTEGLLRTVARSDHNPHGFLIERWATLENKDLHTQPR